MTKAKEKVQKKVICGICGREVDRYELREHNGPGSFNASILGGPKFIQGHSQCLASLIEIYSENKTRFNHLIERLRNEMKGTGGYDQLIQILTEEVFPRS